ncbi:hypothetical protein D3C80_1100960 [compost metagenome]
MSTALEISHEANDFAFILEVIGKRFVFYQRKQNLIAGGQFNALAVIFELTEFRGRIRYVAWSMFVHAIKCKRCQLSEGKGLGSSKSVAGQAGFLVALHGFLPGGKCREPQGHLERLRLLQHYGGTGLEFY